ncbi:hypothetical protein ALC60_07735 [Trachymyrmex zeteki]|uniref:Uncharacterized protein n=1 Tax=Mycetomoellerius zeteki TaxID=64791 RepID=A0A151WYP6_9HYME|nr:hypothetical protein ALC60_07735 [Trachymyrmex zeteki]
MSHFLNRAVILDSSDKRFFFPSQNLMTNVSITHLIAPLCDRCIEYHRGKAGRAIDDTGTIRRPLNTRDIGVKSPSVHLTPEYMYTANAYVMRLRKFTKFSLELDSVSCITSMSLFTRVQIELEIVSTLTKARSDKS